ncbi:hypothetical protein FOMPIDRAFT_1062863 [Fomitopsis schrenkii]|uniref:F-box domain-containing protein n=1 Tax=Fomitopsis schrenkii TaxID=2126942 RepID=S8DVJ6_FOMSC|nr:hypothetical protein FOMPIDRAFT_1062863 [Fomitopsis schrenkii]
MVLDRSNLLASLNEDVFDHILEGLRVRDLSSLSSTCTWLREACMPFVFNYVHICVREPIQIEHAPFFLPASAKPYVRSLALLDECWDQQCGGRPRPKYLYTDDFLLCGAYPGAALAERLQELPRCRSVKMHKNNDLKHGLSWDTLLSVLSVPHLRKFELRFQCFCPALRPGEELSVDSLAPLTAFRYKMEYPRDIWFFPSEVAALEAVLGKLCDTLEELVLPSEPAPMSTLATLSWPRLREFVVRGSPSTWGALPAPLVLLFSAMRGLRAISFKINPLDNALPPAVWPRGFVHSFPWPELERLMVSYPDPSDELWDHLPPTLRALSLRCWPHVSSQRRFAFLGRMHPPRFGLVPTSSDLLSILRHCEALSLDHLEIEYRVDDEDEALLRYVVTTFPHLTSLAVLRYRRNPPIPEECGPCIRRHSLRLLDSVVSNCT